MGFFASTPAPALVRRSQMIWQPLESNLSVTRNWLIQAPADPKSLAHILICKIWILNSPGAQPFQVLARSILQIQSWDLKLRTSVSRSVTLFYAGMTVCFLINQLLQLMTQNNTSAISYGAKIYSAILVDKFIFKRFQVIQDLNIFICHQYQIGMVKNSANRPQRAKLILKMKSRLLLSCVKREGIQVWQIYQWGRVFPLPSGYQQPPRLGERGSNISRHRNKASTEKRNTPQRFSSAASVYFFLKPPNKAPTAGLAGTIPTRFTSEDPAAPSVDASVLGAEPD